MSPPQELGINDSDSQRILRWTNEFHNKFRDYGKTFDDRPSWAESFDLWAWYSEGYAIVKLLNSHFPVSTSSQAFRGMCFLTMRFAEMLG